MMKDLDEFEVIRELLKKANLTEDIVVSPGEDDSCLLKSIENPVITTDTQKENVHFKREWQTPSEIGHKAVTVTLSDLAASFAEPCAVFVNLSLPENISMEFLNELYDGINSALKMYNCALGGGNISSGKEFSIDLFAIGKGTVYHPKRGNAKEGEYLCTTGSLGEAKAGLEILQKRVKGNSSLVEKFKNPKARFDVIRILKKNGVNCVTDISDGLSGDSKHIADASNLSVKFLPSKIKISENLIGFCDGDEELAKKYIFSGGEDYELLFTCRKESFQKISDEIDGVFVVGEMVERDEKILINVPDGSESFRHGS